MHESDRERPRIPAGIYKLHYMAGVPCHGLNAYTSRAVATERTVVCLYVVDEGSDGGRDTVLADTRHELDGGRSIQRLGADDGSRIQHELWRR